MNKDLEQAKALLENNEEYTCAACRAGESFASEEHGIRPLMRWLNEGTDLSGASAADRIVGKAAAFLYVLLGVRTVYAPLMSVPARKRCAPTASRRSRTRSCWPSATARTRASARWRARYGTSPIRARPRRRWNGGISEMMAKK